jgi:hypothetical protein
MFWVSFQCPLPHVVIVDLTLSIAMIFTVTVELPVMDSSLEQTNP